MRPRDLATLLDMVRDGAVSNTAAKRIFAIMVQTGELPAQIAEREGLAQVGDEGAARGLGGRGARRAVGRMGSATVAGEKKLLGVFVGAVMKKSGGRADPKKVNQLLATRASG